MNKMIKVVAVVAIVVFAGAFYWHQSGDVNDLTSRTEYETQLKCLACDHEYGAELNVADRAPFVCPACGKKEAWFIWRCNACDTRFVPEPEGNPPRQPMMPRCPECGSQSTGRLAPGE